MSDRLFLVRNLRKIHRPRRHLKMAMDWHQHNDTSQARGHPRKQKQACLLIQIEADQQNVTILLIMISKTYLPFLLIQLTVFLSQINGKKSGCDGGSMLTEMQTKSSIEADLPESAKSGKFRYAFYQLKCRPNLPFKWICQNPQNQSISICVLSHLLQMVKNPAEASQKPDS